eukprot:gene9317-12553_t
MRSVLISSCIIALVPVSSFFVGKIFQSNANKLGSSVTMVATEKPVATIDGPDFYWQYRLERLSNRQGSALAFNAKNYPDVSGYKDLYDAYYLDLTLQGKLEGFDWEAEKKITDLEWQTIYNSISKWTKEVAKLNKPDNSNIPKNDFDLLKRYYPQLNFRDIETPFSPEEVGTSFPYKNMKEMLGAAVAGTLNIPGYSGVTSLDTSDAKAKLESLKSESEKKIDAIYQKVLAFANSPFPDEESKKHYKDLKTKLASFPQSSAEWSTYRAKLDAEVNEMAILASKKDEHPHGHHEEEEGEGDHEHAHEAHLSPAQEFEAKYGRNLDEMQERFSRFKSDPVGFLESSIIEKHGKNGLDIWKKSQEFSAQFAVLSVAERSKVEKEFSDFISSA